MQLGNGLKTYILVRRSPGYVVLPQVQRPLDDSSSVESHCEHVSSGPSYQQFANPGGSVPLSFPQVSNSVFIPSQVPGANITYGERLSTLTDSQVEAQKKSIQNQIEVPQNDS